MLVDGPVAGALGQALKPVPGCRVQLFCRTPTGEVRWRLLSNNNREIGRGSDAYPDAETCRLAIKHLQESLDRFQPVVRRAEGGNAWVWQLQYRGTVVASSPHLYDRQIRCGRAVNQFLAEIRDAVILNEVMTSHARRWGGSVA